MWLEGSGECRVLYTEVWWAGKRERSADEKNGRGNTRVWGPRWRREGDTSVRWRLQRFEGKESHRVHVEKEILFSRVASHGWVYYCPLFTSYSIIWHVYFSLFLTVYYPVECYMGLSPHACACTWELPASYHQGWPKRVMTQKCQLVTIGGRQWLILGRQRRSGWKALERMWMIQHLKSLILFILLILTFYHSAAWAVMPLCALVHVHLNKNNDMM